MSRNKPGRAKAPAAAQSNSGPRPAGGGSYVRDRATGELELLEQTAPAQPFDGAPVELPADTETNTENGETSGNDAATAGQQEA